MNKKLKVMAISAVAALIFALPLAAQNVETNPAGGPTSNLRQATAELYKTDVDNFSNVNNWAVVNFSSWFGFVHGTNAGPTTTIDSSGANTFRGNLGFATKVAGIYLGVRYYGNIFEDTGGEESVTLTPAYDQTTQQLFSLTEKTDYPNKWHNSTNQIDILVGVAGQGIKVGFFESMTVRPDGYAPQSFSKTDYQNGNIFYEGETIEYSRVGGFIRPSVQWGSVFNLSGMTLKPRASLYFNIFQDKEINEYYADYTAFNGKPIEPRAVTRIGHDNGYLQTGISVGADLGLPKKNDMAMTFTLDYTVNFDSYNNDYSASGFDGETKGPVRWTDAGTTTTTSIANRTTTTTATLNFAETSRSSHSIAPRVTLDKTVSDSLKIGLAVLAPITVRSESTDKYSETKTFTTENNYNATNSADAKSTTNTTVHTPGGLTETTSFTFSPSVRFGASYNLIPDRFTVNAGVRLDPFVLTNTSKTESRNGTGTQTTSTTKNGDGVVISKTDTTVLGTGGYYLDRSTVTNRWGALGGSLAGGFVFNFNENVALDLLSCIGYYPDLNRTRGSFDLDLTYVNVMLSFKF
jgi:hypothetical protein